MKASEFYKRLFDADARRDALVKFAEDRKRGPRKTSTAADPEPSDGANEILP